MVYHYMLWGVVASLLGVVLLYHSTGKNSIVSSMEVQRNECLKSSENVACPSDFGGNAGIIVVGAGVAGSALAYTLGKDGCRVCVIERDLSESDRIVGELLQPGGFLKLIELGLEDCVGEIDAQSVHGYTLFKDGRSIKLSYLLEKFDSEVAGRSFHHGRFIQRMREKLLLFPSIHSFSS